jgi:phospholipase C
MGAGLQVGRMGLKRLVAAALPFALTACMRTMGGVPAGDASGNALAAQRAHTAVQPAGSGKIQHVVIVIQENRSFDNMFNAFPGANTVSQGLDSKGQELQLAVTPLKNTSDVGHALSDFLSAYDGGKMDGFDKESNGGKPSYYPYERALQSDVQPYWDMASQYVLFDNNFPSQLDASFVAHQYLIAAQADSAVDIPTAAWGCANGYDQVKTITQQRTYGPYESPCFDYTTIADELDAKGLTWRFYAPQTTMSGGMWSAFQAINHIYQYGNGPEWLANVISPETEVLSLGPDGTLPSVTWVVPSLVNSDHPGNGSGSGPSWVTSVVNEIGESQYWDNTVIFVLWDDWGGMYDHVPPPQADYDGLGIRTPLICISPYARAGKVSHVQTESSSIVRFIEETFHLKTLAAADKRAVSAGKSCLDFKQAPRTFQPFTAPYSPAYFAHQVPDYQPPDDD